VNSAILDHSGLERVMLKGRLRLSAGFALLLTLAAAGCGGSGPAGPHKTATIPGINTALPPTAERGAILTSAIPRGQKVRGDGDADNPGDLDGNGDIDPEDGDSDYPVRSSYLFPDTDDEVTLDGRSPDASERGAIAAVVRAYYAAAAAENGTLGCSLLTSSLAASAVEDYGSTGASAALRGAKTCAALLSALFRNSHQELAGPVEIFAVRASGAEAHVVLTSRTLRASSIELARQAGHWRVQELLGSPLP
jgi:hypothetical protein